MPTQRKVSTPKRTKSSLTTLGHPSHTLSVAIYEHLLVTLARTISLTCAQKSILPTLPCPHCRGRCWRYHPKSGHGFDIYGQRTGKLNQVLVTKKVANESDASKEGGDESAVTSTEVECTNCGKPVEVSRFAPHLEKCAAVHKIHGTVASRKNKRRAASTGAFFAEGSSEDIPEVEGESKVTNMDIEDEEYKYEEQHDEFDSPHPPRIRNKRTSTENSPKSNVILFLYFVEKGKKTASTLANVTNRTIPVDDD